jgi:hypothetical protein
MSLIGSLTLVCYLYYSDVSRHISNLLHVINDFILLKWTIVSFGRCIIRTLVHIGGPLQFFVYMDKKFQTVRDISKGNRMY